MEEQYSKSTKRRARQGYDAVKAEVAKLEKQNFSKIIAFKSGASGEWYKIGGNSMLIYYYEVCQKILNIHPNIQPDTDFSTTNFETGVICVRGLETLEKRLKKAEVLKARRIGGGTVVYDLKIKLSEETLNKLREETVAARERALSVVRPNATLDPETYRLLRHLQKRMYEEARKMTAFDRAYVGEDAARVSRKMTELYFDMSEGLTPAPEGWKMIYKLANDLSYLMNFMTDLKISQVAPMTRLWDDLTQLIRQVKRMR